MKFFKTLKLKISERIKKMPARTYFLAPSIMPIKTPKQLEKEKRAFREVKKLNLFK